MGLEEISKPDQADEKIHPFPMASQRKQKVPLSQLINKLNRLNFKGESVLFNLKHRKHGHTISMRALPQPCVDQELECAWLEVDEVNDQRLQAFELVNLTLTDGQRLIQVEPMLVTADSRQITVQLPDESFETGTRIIRRHSCPGIKVTMVANSAMYSGELVDYNAFYFRIKLEAQPPQTFDWISGNIPVNLTMFDGTEIAYVGDCKVVRHTAGQRRREYVLQPARSQFPRYQAREHRSERRELLPNLNVVFKHPVTQKTMNLKMVDLSGTGFALIEPYQEATLLPGMILKEVGIHLTSRTKLNCKAQVIHRTQSPDSSTVKVGLTLLDIDSQDHMELISILQQAKDPDTYVSNHVDPESLWDFFFETGFIYPKKYLSLAEHKETFKTTYAKLYTEHPEIARHFIHMEHNKILGHFALLRLYDKTWCLNHHAAIPDKRKSGLRVLERLCEFINDTHMLSSAKTLYSAGFYRADNKFPAKYFGGMTKHLDNPKASSIDEFAYLQFEGTPPDYDDSAMENWELLPVRPGDLEDLRGFYEKVSGGLLLNAMDMQPEDLQNSDLTEDYAKAGFKRTIQRLAIKKNGELKAVVVVNRSDTGMNFSELTNTTYLFITDNSGFNRKCFQHMISRVAAEFNMDSFPLMVFPTSYMQDNDIPFEKTYCCNILNAQSWDDYMRYMRTFMKKAKLR